MERDGADRDDLILLIWTSALRELRDWSEEDVILWASQFTDARQDPDSLFHHDPAVSYISPLLIPEAIGQRLAPDELRALERELERAVIPPETVFLTAEDVERHDWGRARRAVDQVLRRCGGSLAMLRADR